MAVERKERIDIDISGLNLPGSTSKFRGMLDEIGLCFDQFMNLTFDGLRGPNGNVFEEVERSGTSRMWKFGDIRMELLYNEAGNKKMLSVLLEGKGDGYVMDEVLERIGNQKRMVESIGKMLKVGRRTEIIEINGTHVIDNWRNRDLTGLITGEAPVKGDSVLFKEVHEELVKAVFGESTRFRSGWNLNGKDGLNMTTTWDASDLSIKVVSDVVKRGGRFGRTARRGGKRHRVGSTGKALVYVEKRNVKNRFFLVITNNGGEKEMKETEELFDIFCARTRKRKQIMESTGMILQHSEIANRALTREFLNRSRNGDGRVAPPSAAGRNSRKQKVGR